MEGGFVCFNGDGVASCTRCGWRGAATVVGGVRSTYCPACEDDTEQIVAELERRRAYRGTARNAPCPCGSGAKYKKCCGR